MGLRWSEEEDARLRQLVEQGLRAKDVATLLGRTKAATAFHAGILRIRFRGNRAMEALEPDDVLRSRWLGKIDGMKAALRDEIERGVSR